ncbi:hypothetical protein ENSA5_19690 [Enhygromyxa salina]|uniref:Knr4/Smi1-like domain-containing protein n=1 Tax=Enhygromyxa salina TaxID=215803 RepID=A0A2S9YD33_9BACT|nr:SMI1/KNR4 family protein [Enhygromyxa salina]PRQ03030.1 hypothetical protein ENSA5_19690 [Enhygromyxa salina]
MTTENPISAIIDEICQIEPEFREDIRGVDRALIERLEQLHGRPLPAVYRDFLRHMGESWGIELPRTDFTACRIVSYYEKIAWRPPEPFTMIGMDNFGNSQDYFLDGRGSREAVVSFPLGTDPTAPDADPNDFEFESASLPDYIFSMFFMVRHLSNCPAVVQASKVTHLDGSFERAVDVVRRYGLPEHPRSSGGYAYFYTPELSAAISQPPGYGLGVRISGRDGTGVERLYALLDHHVGLVHRNR